MNIILVTVCILIKVSHVNVGNVVFTFYLLDNCFIYLEKNNENVSLLFFVFNVCIRDFIHMVIFVYVFENTLYLNINRYYIDYIEDILFLCVLIYYIKKINILFRDVYNFFIMYLNHLFNIWY